VRTAPKATSMESELSRFAFLVGSWRCKADVKPAEGKWLTYEATWRGRYILDGRAIEDEYRMFDAAGKTIVLGMNYRAYNAAKRIWNIKWLDALTGTWLDLGPPELGGVTVDGNSISYAFKEPMAGHAYTRATYTNVSESRFTWRGESSEDGRSWRDFMVIEAYRNEE
jgi:hypothetical protein